jgi:CheY-like chemotaxis protein
MARPRRPVLVVEDNRRTREAVERLLHLQGYTVLTFADGQEALDYLHQGGPACLIILDIRLPRLDGRAFRARQLEDPELARIPVVVFSADSVNPLDGVAAFVRKSEPDALLRYVERHCTRDE